MMLQLNPTIPVFSVKHNQNGYAFAIIDYSQEHYVIFLVGLDNGEIWCISNKDLRMQDNDTLHRKTEQEDVEIKVMSPFDPKLVFRQKEKEEINLSAPPAFPEDRVEKGQSFKEEEKKQTELADKLTLAGAGITTKLENIEAAEKIKKWNEDLAKKLEKIEIDQTNKAKDEMIKSFNKIIDAFPDKPASQEIKRYY